MINFFPELKKPRSDGLASALDLEDFRNPYEIYFGLFGEEDSGPGSSGVPDELSNMSTDGTQGPGDVGMADDGDFSGFSTEQSAPVSGTVFGVGGVSKTGSTAQDQTIGWSDGKGGKGANHGALSGATSEQMGVVDAVAAKSKAQGLSATDTQAAVANALSGYEKGSVDNSGGLTDKGKDAVNAAITGVGKDKASQDVEDSYGVPVGMGFSPSVSATDVLSGVPTTSVSAPSINASNVLSAVSDLAAQSLAARSPTSQGRPGAPTTGIASLAVDSLDRSNPNAMAAAERDQLLGAFGSNVQSGPVTDAQIGITAAPAVSAQEVLGLAPASTGLTSTGLIGAQGPPGMVSRSAPPGTVDFSLDFPGTELDSTITGTGSLANALDFAFDGINSTTAQDIANARAAEASNRASVASPMSSVSAPASVSAQEVLSGLPDELSTPAMSSARASAPGQLSAEQLAAMDRNMPSMVDAETDVMARDLSDVNRAGYSRGLPTGLEFATNLSTGTDFTTNLAGTTEAQRAEMPGYIDNLAKDSKLTGFLAQDPYGYEIDPVTGRVTGTVGAPSQIGMVGNLLTGLQNLTMGPPVDSRDLVERGVYSGYGAGYDAMMDDMMSGAGDQEVVKAPTDPCPPGFVMRDGVCTPVEEVSNDAGGGSGNFVFQPPTAPPTFQPITQATPLNQINPFVLQPYTPMQAQNIGASRVAQGIQTLSPTGAALGRQI